MKNFLTIYKNKRIFITGHTGFKGSWLTFLLNEIGAKVTGFSMPQKRGKNHFNLLSLDKKINHIEGDIRDEKSILRAIKNSKPDFVFHLAAQSLVKKSYDDPIETYTTNVVGSLNLLNALREIDSIPSLVFITSDKCYENVEWNWGYRENDRLGGIDPYSASKASAEILFSSYNRSFFLNKKNFGAASARAGNVIGGGDWAENRIIPDAVRSIEKKIPLIMRSPNSTRPWQHVLEPLSGYLLLGEKLYVNPIKYSSSWNFGPSTDDIRNVKSVTEDIFKHIGAGKIKILKSKTKIHEANLLQLNCDKARQVLKWKPRWNVDKTLKETALWYKRLNEGEKAEDITREQIYDFFHELR